MSDVTAPPVDTIAAILGDHLSDAVAGFRASKPELIDQLEAYYAAIFDPTEASAAQFPVQDRALVAARVASHTGSTAVVEWYRNLAIELGASAELTAHVIEGAQPATQSASTAAALRHADLLTTAPADASAEDLQALKAAGLTPGAILALSQTIAFVSYQLRLIAGFRALGELA
jgi:uncharacterized protein YciW